jgi:hypothetical protein
MTTRTSMGGSGVVYLLGALAACFGCSDADGAHDEGVGSTSDPLYMWSGATPWPGGTVPVCWTSASSMRSDFATRSVQVRTLLENSWPSVANVRFTGWDVCSGSSPANRVNISLNDSMNANAGGFGVGNWTMSLGTGRSDFTGGLIPHEFGHNLGFTHEMARPDFADDATGSCQEANTTGSGLDTAPDRNSIMASTGYCQTNATLSIWDAIGSITQYGAQVTGISPLVSAWHGGNGDHGTMSTAAGIASMRSAAYSFAYPDGWVYNTQLPGTVPLKLYWHAGRADNYSTATSAGESGAIAAGYSFVRIEGYVYSSSQPGTVPLKLFWHGGRGDNFTTTTAAGEAAALAAGYSFVSNEGWVFQNVPYSTLWGYWHSGRGDNLTTEQNSSLAAAAESAAYAYSGMDGVVLKHQVTGTVPLKSFWHGGRGDHFETATAAGESSALAAGYTLVRTEGYVFSNTATGLSPMKSYWHGGREDNFTTVTREAAATGAGYSLVRTEGYTFATRP